MIRGVTGAGKIGKKNTFDGLLWITLVLHGGQEHNASLTDKTKCQCVTCKLCWSLQVKIFY